MENTKGIPTTYNGINFRSRLEARWAAMFDLLGWKYEYEPCDFAGWIPDFLLKIKEPVFVEVKPVIDFPKDVAEEIEKSGCGHECLILGMTIDHAVANKDYLRLGWLAEVSESKNFWWAEAVLAVWMGSRTIGFCHAYGYYGDRVTGSDEEGQYGTSGTAVNEIIRLWKIAGNTTQWRKK